MREHDEGNSRKIPRLRDKLKAENQREKFVQADGHGPERGTDLQNFEILMCNCICIV